MSLGRSGVLHSLCIGSLATILLTGCGEFDRLYKDRGARCKVHCNQNNGDSGPDPRTLPRDTPPPPLDAATWVRRAYEAAGTTPETATLANNALKFTRERDASALTQLAGINPMLGADGALVSLPSLLLFPAWGTKSFAGVDPARPGLNPAQKCMAEAFWATPAPSGSSFSGTANVGRCVPLVELDSSSPLQRGISFEQAWSADVAGAGGGTPDHLSTLATRAPFLWANQTNESSGIYFRMNAMRAMDIDRPNGGSTERIRTFSFSAFRGRQEGTAFRFEHNTAASSTVLDGLVELAGAEVSNPTGSEYAGSGGEGYHLQVAFYGFTMTGSDGRPSLNMGFTRNTALTGSYVIVANGLIAFQVDGTGTPCVVQRTLIASNAEGQLVREPLGGYDLCASLN